MANFLEQLVAEWYEFNGYFVRQNVNVGKRMRGGWEGELDVVAFHPLDRHLIHIEPSMDADSWKKREERYARKFAVGRKHIPELFDGIKDLPEIEQIALFVFGSSKEHTTIGGGRVVLIKEFMNEVHEGLKAKSVASAAVPEGFPIIRTLQFAANYWK